MLNKYNNRSSELLQVIALWLELSLQQADASLLCFVSSPHKPAQQISTMSKAMSWPQILEVHVFPWSLPSLTASSIEKAGPQRWGKLKNQGRWWKSGSLVCREWMGHFGGYLGSLSLTVKLERDKILYFHMKMEAWVEKYASEVSPHGNNPVRSV